MNDSPHRCTLLFGQIKMRKFTREKIHSPSDDSFKNFGPLKMRVLNKLPLKTFKLFQTAMFLIRSPPVQPVQDHCLPILTSFDYHAVFKGTYIRIEKLQSY